MTSYQGMELATLIMQDVSVAIPLLRLLHAFKNSHRDPLADAMTNDVLHHVWSRIDRCEEAMVAFIREEEERDSTQSPKAA